MSRSSYVLRRQTGRGIMYTVPGIPELCTLSPELSPEFLGTFRTLTTPSRCRLRLSAGSAMSAREQHVSDPTGLRTFWFMPVSPFGTLDMTTVKRRFTWVGRASHPWLPTALGLAVATEPRGVVTRPGTEATLSRALRTPGLPPTHGPIGD
jgi:hypothetical protein